MKQILTALLFALTLAAVAPANAQLLPQAQNSPAQDNASHRIDRIVAVVNEGVILQSDLDQAVQTVKQQNADQPGQLPPDNVLKQKVLQQLILMKLQVQKAGEQGIRVSNDEVSQAVSRIASQNHMKPAQLRQAIGQRGGSFGQFQQQIADQIMVRHLRDSVVQKNVSITDSEVNNLLKNPVYSGGKVHLAHIRISIPAGASASDIQAAQSKAKKVLNALKNGMDFNSAAIRYSDADDALKGGNLGWRSMDEVPKAFVDIITKMQPGQTTPPLRGPNGFQILKLLGRKAAQQKMVTEYHARQILIKPSQLVSAQQARKKANDIYHRIVDKHESFAKLAKKYSDDDTTANAGGDMDWFPQDAWGSVIAGKIVQLKDGEVSKPFKVQGAWDILKRLAVRTKDRTDASRRNQAREAIGNRKAKEAYDNFLRQLRSTGYVDIRVPALKPPKDDNHSADGTL